MLKHVLEKEKIASCIKSDEIFLQILNKHTPLKRKLLRANHASHISEPLRKTIVKWLYLENLYLKKHTDYFIRIIKSKTKNKILQHAPF